MNITTRHQRLERLRMRRKLYKAIDARVGSNDWRVRRTLAGVSKHAPLYVSYFAEHYARCLGVRDHGQASRT